LTPTSAHRYHLYNLLRPDRIVRILPDMSESDQPQPVPADFPSTHAELSLRGPVGRLEALTEPPENEDIGITAIVCGPADSIGTMHSKVVNIVERSLRELGAATIRFNYRGVGRSDGELEAGVGAAEDLLAVANWAQQVRPDTQLWLAGYGFGAFIAIVGCQKLGVAQLVTVAPPVEHFDFAALPEPQCPWLVIQGESDELVNPDAVRAWIETLETPPQVLHMDEADHSFHRRLMDLRGAIKNGIRRQQRSEADPGA
jgi:alpha/beta superfamily hydrolase